MSEDPEFDPEDMLPDMIQDNWEGKGLCIEYIASIADLSSAISCSGKAEGGGRISYDVPESELGALAAHMPLTQSLLRIRVTLASPEESDSFMKPKKKNKPTWAGGYEK